MERSMKLRPEQGRQLPGVALRESLRLMDRPSVPAHGVANDGTRLFPTVAADCHTCSGTGVSPFRDGIERLPCLACGGTGREDEVEEFVAVAPKSLTLPLVVVGTLVSLSLAFLLVSANLTSNGIRDSGTAASAVNISAEARRQVHQRLMAGRTQVEFPASQDDRVESLGNNVFQVTSWVDSRVAGFAATTRTRYTMLLRQEGRDRWTVEGLTSIP